MAQAPETFGRGEGGEIPNYLAPAVLGIFCCFPLALVGLLQAARVNTLKAQGDFAGARQASEQAKFWTFASLGVGIILYLILIIVTLVSFSVNASLR